MKTIKKIDDVSISYTKYKIKKKSGKLRTICAPAPELKNLQRRLAVCLNDIYIKIAPPFVHGFIQNKSIKTNAQVHLNKKIVINIDLKDYFDTCTKDMISKALSNFKIEEEEIHFITKYCCYNNFLPQGSPCSPILSNFCFYETDLQISKYCQERNITYSRYADDLSFSTDEIMRVKQFITDISSIVSDFGFKINYKKIAVMRSTQSQSVTNISVNNKVRPSKKILNHYRGRLFKAGLKDRELSLEEKGYLSFLHSINPEIKNKMIQVHANGKNKLFY